MISKAVRLLPDLVFLAWIFTFFHLFVTGKYLLYLRSGFGFLIVAGLVLSMILLWGGGLNKSRQVTPLSTIIMNSIIIIMPIFFYMISADASLGGFAFSKKRTQDTINKVVDINGSRSKKKVFKDKNKVEQIPISLLLSPFYDLNGNMVETKGQIYIEDGKPYIVLYRFIMSCCAADARPIGVYLPKNSMTKDLKKDEWVVVTGRFDGSKKHKGERIRIITPTSIKKVDSPSPKDLYLYN